MHRFIREERDRTMLIRLIQQHEMPFTINVTKGIKRTLAQNRLIHMWYGEIAEQTGDVTGDVELRCKLEIGVPILRAEDEEFCKIYDKHIKPFSYEDKLEAMKRWPVTSIMKTRQCKRYLDEMFWRYATNGVVLTIPDTDDYTAPTTPPGTGAKAGAGNPPKSAPVSSYAESKGM